MSGRLFTYPRILPCGDRALMVEFGESIDPEINRRAVRFAENVRAAALPGVGEAVPAYRSVLIEYDPLVWPNDSLDRRLAALLRTAAEEGGKAKTAVDEHRLFEIPTWYGGADLDDVAAHCGLSPAEVTTRHAASVYTVYAVGFSPGFAYLGGLPSDLTVPRLSAPRPKVPAGSVAVGGQQTGIYPRESPGGWRLIGLTNVSLFDLSRSNPALLQAGDRVRFVPVSETEYRRGQGTDSGTVRCWRS